MRWVTETGESDGGGGGRVELERGVRGSNRDRGK